MKAIASIFVLFFLGISITAHAQQNNHWYFGRKACMNFNSSGIQPVPTLFANRVTIYNNQYQVMSNRDGLYGNISAAQTKDEKKQAAGSDHIVSFGINLPLGDFSSTHLVGFDIGYSPGTHVFGLVKNKHFAFTYNGGVAYYAGKKETVSSYPYKYPEYLFVHAFAGL
ncbi:MAG: hypothetical protein AAB221_02060, partial [Bacteroidota bacterium]